MSYQLASREPDSFDLGAEDRSDAFSTLVGRSDRLLQAIRVARRIATRGGANFLIVGEAGTGKELFARAIHYAGPQPNEPFVAVNCAAIPAALLESELFGHERGAFTDTKQSKQGLLELAGDGTLFLDEVSSLPFDLQPKLLRALEERRVRRVGGYDEIKVRCRVCAVSNVSLETLVEVGLFREDLFYRLNALRIVIPPLRERDGDIEPLAEHFLQVITEAKGLPPVALTPAALACLRRHSWPGNVRQLKNVLGRALVMSDGQEIDDVHLLHELARSRRAPATASELGRPDGAILVPAGGRSLRSVEAELIRMTLGLTRGNKSAAARVLGISRPTLDRKIDVYDIVLGTEA